MTIPEGTISRVHAELEYTSDEKLLIKDLGSGNKLFLKLSKRHFYRRKSNY
jgi:pSer/pThr/pTyr-binding forkhead associated (FHA) protein